jgi:hypothetical protein
LTQVLVNIYIWKIKTIKGQLHEHNELLFFRI